MPITLEGKKGMKMSQLTVKHCKMSAMLSTNSCETSYSQFMFTIGSSTETLTQTDDKRNGLTFDVCGSVHLGNMFYSNPTGCTIFFFLAKFLALHVSDVIAAILYNKTCRRKELTPAYINIHI
jgi:hypothetical protein